MYFNSCARPIIKYVGQAAKKCNLDLSVHFTTNAVILNDSILNFLSSYKVSLQITLDGGREAHNKTRFLHNGKGTYNRIITNISKALANGLSVIVRINYTKDNICTINDIIESISTFDRDTLEKLTVDFQRVWQDSESRNRDAIYDMIISYTNRLKELGTKVSCHLIHDYVRDTCYGNRTNSVLINYNGYIYKCTARKFIPENSDGHLNEDGTIGWNEERMKLRSNIRFKKPVCRTCRVAPICGGGCTQRCLEDLTSNKCMYSYSEEEINDMILNRFEYMFMLNEQDA